MSELDKKIVTSKFKVGNSGYVWAKYCIRVLGRPYSFGVHIPIDLPKSSRPDYALKLLNMRKQSRNWMTASDAEIAIMLKNHDDLLQKNKVEAI